LVGRCELCRLSQTAKRAAWLHHQTHRNSVAAKKKQQPQAGSKPRSGFGYQIEHQIFKLSKFSKVLVAWQ
jgi:hypothetical protein